MKNEFLIGCNYWASNSGTEMWRNFDESVIRNDLKILTENGIEYMRVSFRIGVTFNQLYPFIPRHSRNTYSMVTLPRQINIISMNKCLQNLDSFVIYARNTE